MSRANSPVVTSLPAQASAPRQCLIHVKRAPASPARPQIGA
jgi:hypothetical protein